MIHVLRQYIHEMSCDWTDLSSLVYFEVLWQRGRCKTSQDELMDAIFSLRFYTYIKDCVEKRGFQLKGSLL